MPSRTTWAPYDFRRPTAWIAARDATAVMPHRPDGRREVLDRRMLERAGDHVVELRRDLLTEGVERVDDLEGRLSGRGPVADVPVEAQGASPPGRLAVGVDHPPLRRPIDVDDELARPAPVDAEDLASARRRVDPFADEHATEPHLAHLLAGSNADDDLVEPLAPTLLDVDVSAQGAGDGRREVAAGKLLRTLVEGKVSIGDVDRLVRHGGIVAPRNWMCDT